MSIRSICFFGFWLLLFLFHSNLSFSQSKLDSVFQKLDAKRFATVVSGKAHKLQEAMLAKATKVLSKAEKQERKLYSKMLKGKDSLLTKESLKEINGKYAELKAKLKNPVSDRAKVYIPGLDSLNSSLKFLDQNTVSGKVKDALAKTELLQGNFDQAEQIKKFIKERRELLKQQLEKLGMVKQLKKINKAVYYYSAKLQEYKTIISDPKKIERKALEILGKTKIFQEFMRKNSLLASLFRLPGADDPSSQVSLAGLQTRTQVNNLIQQQISSGGPNAQQQIQQNIQAAQAQLNDLKSKLFKAGGNYGDSDMPDFKPNSQKTKSFFDRLEYGTNVQSQKANSFFPSTTDIGLSLGYRLNEKSIVGIGASYKVGLGRGWNAIELTHQGIGIRTYTDIKLKGSFWISGGYEQNFKSAFSDFDVLKDRNAWQKSGLIGISKIISLKTKLFKKTSLKLLWDFLSYQQIPRTQPIIFRVSYQLK